MMDKPLYNSRIINTYVKMIARKYPAVDINAVLEYAGMKPYQVNDEGHWFSQRQVNLFNERMATATGNPEISREAGRFAASGESLGAMTKYVLGLIGPAHSFAAIKKSCAKLVRSAVYESRRLAANKVEITVTPREGITEKEFQCRNRIGFFEAIVTVFDYDFPVVEHPECIFKGDARCRYVVSWKTSLYSRLRSWRNALSAASLALCALIAWSGSLYAAAQWATVPVFTALLLCFVAERLEKMELYRSLLSLKENTDELLDQIGVNYNNALMVNEVGQAISKQSGIDEVLDTIVGTMEHRLGFDRCVIMLADPEQKQLYFSTGFGHSDDTLAYLKRSSFDLLNPESKGVFVSCFREQRPFLVDDYAEISSTLSANSVSFASTLQATSFICCPIVCENQSLGVLAVDNIRSKKPLTQSDMSLLMGVAPVIGMSIRNGMYIQRERRLAERMRHSQKMEAVGQLAGGVAHDFNNLLTAITSFTSLAQMKTEDSHPSKPQLQQIMLTAQKATQITQSLLSFSRKQASNPQPHEVGQIVRSMESVLRRLMTKEIDLTLSLAGEALTVMAESGQIDQILLNLATNARDAMGGSGSLVIATSQVRMDAQFVESHQFGAVGDYALVSVSDTGSGMDAETKARIFEPFFTTKEAGKGTGLGLAIVYSAVQQQKGHIDIHSEPGKGTTFHIYLPLLAREASPFRLVPGNKPTDLGTVLVVEDAPDLLKVTKRLLEISGFRVIEAVDGQDAVEKFAAQPDEVSLVIMDLMLPRMNGGEAYRHISRIRPGLKVLFTSGRDAEEIEREGIDISRDNFLDKPAAPHELLEKVRHILAA